MLEPRSADWRLLLGSSETCWDFRHLEREFLNNLRNSSIKKGFWKWIHRDLFSYASKIDKSDHSGRLRICWDENWLDRWSNLKIIFYFKRCWRKPVSCGDAFYSDHKSWSSIGFLGDTLNRYYLVLFIIYSMVEVMCFYGFVFAWQKYFHGSSFSWLCSYRTRLASVFVYSWS